MILISKIEVMVVPDNEQHYKETLAPYPVGVPGMAPKDVIIFREMINGEKFINANGKTVCIGMTEKVQQLIGLPFKAFKNLNLKVDSLQHLYEYQNVLIKSYKYKERTLRRLNWWGRFKLVFTGYKNIL